MGTPEPDLAEQLRLLLSADPDTARRRRRILAAAVERAIDLMDAIDAATEDLEPDPDLEDGSDLEAVDEDGDPLDRGERDGLHSPRRPRVPRTDRPRAMARREAGRLAVIAAVVTSPDVVRFPGRPAHA